MSKIDINQLLETYHNSYMDYDITVEPVASSLPVDEEQDGEEWYERREAEPMPTWKQALRAFGGRVSKRPSREQLERNAAYYAFCQGLVEQIVTEQDEHSYWEFMEWEFATIDELAWEIGIYPRDLVAELRQQVVDTVAQTTDLLAYFVAMEPAIRRGTHPMLAGHDQSSRAYIVGRSWMVQANQESGVVNFNKQPGADAPGGAEKAVLIDLKWQPSVPGVVVEVGTDLADSSEVVCDVSVGWWGAR
ncbi:hypothetical protein [Corynebacterium lizhenjunii]|uniref:hypothetical protein n=1 Tax=Corynebacterium lizhenjunii TaxID=2709394 RepID=UPI0013EDEEE8|nr:hypothetical protein [Corynebacterium lizhenjunii]